MSVQMLFITSSKNVLQNKDICKKANRSEQSISKIRSLPRMIRYTRNVSSVSHSKDKLATGPDQKDE